MQVIAISNYACITLYDLILLQYVHNYVSYHNIIIILKINLCYIELCLL